MAVVFNEPSAVTRSGVRKRVSFFSRAVIGTGIVKTETGAQVVLFVIGALCLLAAVYFLKDSAKSPPQPTPAQVVL